MEAARLLLFFLSPIVFSWLIVIMGPVLVERGPTLEASCFIHSSNISVEFLYLKLIITEKL